MVQELTDAQARHGKLQTRCSAADKLFVPLLRRRTISSFLVGVV